MKTTKRYNNFRPVGYFRGRGKITPEKACGRTKPRSPGYHVSRLRILSREDIQFPEPCPATSIVSTDPRVRARARERQREREDEAKQSARVVITRR